MNAHTNPAYYFQNTVPGRYLFYKIKVPFNQYTHFAHKKNTQWQSVFNFNLPNEMILEIVSYLSFSDIVNLSISKMFFASFLTMPWYYNTVMQSLFEHLLLFDLKSKHDLFSVCILNPFIYENDIFFFLDTCKIKFFNHMLGKQPYLLAPTVFELFYAIFNSYEFYKTSVNKNHFQYLLRLYPTCHSKCMCHCYTYIKAKNFKLKTKCCHA